MPTTKKRNYKRKTTKRKTKKKMRIPRTIGFPEVYHTRLRYTDILSLTQGTVGVPNLYKFSANGCYDPDITGTGHQPKFFDQFAALYSRYRVIGSKISVKFATKQTDNTSTPPIMVGIVPIDAADGTSSFSGITAVTETRQCRYKEISASMTAKATTVTHTFSNKQLERKFFDREDNNRMASTLISANPTNQIYYYIFSCSLDTLATHPELYAYVTIDYIVSFHDRAQQTQS